MPVLVHRQPQAAADLLPLLHRAPRLVERADLEDVRVVPAFAQGGVAEDEAQRLVERQQPLLVLHDEVVDLVVGLGVAPRVLEHALLVLGEVAVVQPLHRLLEPLQCLIARLLGQLGQLASNASANLPLRRLPGFVVVAVVGHAVDEEQAEHLDARAADLQLLLQVLLDGVLDLRPPDVVAHARRSPRPAAACGHW